MKNVAETAEVKAENKQELKAKQVWAALPVDNPFESPAQVLIAETKENASHVLWVKFSAYRPNVGAQPFEYLAENKFRSQYPKFVQ